MKTDEFRQLPDFDPIRKKYEGNCDGMTYCAQRYSDNRSCRSWLIAVWSRRGKLLTHGVFFHDDLSDAIDVALGTAANNERDAIAKARGE